MLLGAGLCLAPFALLAMAAVSYLTLDSDVRALRRHVMAATDAEWCTKAQVSVGRMTLGAIGQAGTAFNVWLAVAGFASGLLLVPQGVGALLSRTLGGRLTDRLGARWVAMGGFAVLTLATVPFALATATTPTWVLMCVLAVRGFGLGAVFIPLMSVAYEGLERHEMPDASIVTRVAQQLGGSFGVAILAAILTNAALGVTDLAGLAHAFDMAFWWAVGFSVVATAMTFLLPARPHPAGT